MKKRTQSFTWSMILFYFLSTSLINWFSGVAFKDLPFYIFVLVLAGVCLSWVIKIIQSPHVVKSKETTAPTVLNVLGIVFSLSVAFTMTNVAEFFEAIYILCFFTSMAYLIDRYKKTGIVITENQSTQKVEEPETKSQKLPLSETEKLQRTIRDALSVTSNDSDFYKYLIQARTLVSEIIDKRIETPEKVIKQMDTVIQGYIELVLIRIKTTNIYNTLKEIEENFPLIVSVLTNIYESGLENKLTNIEVESETLKNLVDLSGLNDSDFK